MNMKIIHFTRHMMLLTWQDTRQNSAYNQQESMFNYLHYAVIKSQTFLRNIQLGILFCVDTSSLITTQCKNKG